MAAFIYGLSDRLSDSYRLSTEIAFARSGHNTGNFAFVHAISEIVGGNTKCLSWEQDVTLLNGMSVQGIIPCANQLGPHLDYGQLGNKFCELKFPLVAIGLGAQGAAGYEDLPNVPEGTLRWVRAIADRSKTGAPNIGVRGPFTRKVLEHYGLAQHSIVTGCPSLFINPQRDLGRSIENRAEKKYSRIAVAGGHQSWRHLANIEASLVRLMEATGGAYVVQSPIEMIMLARGDAHLVPPDELAKCRDCTKPGMDLEDFKAWSRRYFRVFFGVPEWMEFLRGFDFVVGARIHGVMLALQAGVPGLCVAHDSRTRELCEVMNVPFIMAREIQRDGLSQISLRSAFKFDGKAFDENRLVLAKRLNDFLVSNGLPNSALLKGILSS